MNKLLQTTLIATILSTGAMAGETTEPNPTKLKDGITIFGDMELTSQKIEIGEPIGREKSCVSTYGKIQAKKTSEITTETNAPASFYNGYCFKQENPENPQYLYAHGGIDSRIKADEDKDIKIWQLSVLRSLTHQLDKGEGLPTDPDETITIDLAKDVKPQEQVFLISPTIEDQMGMARLMDTDSKIVSNDPNLKVNIIMQGAKVTDQNYWSEFTSKAPDTNFTEPFRDLKLSLLEEVKGSATLMGECELTVDKDETVIPTSLKSAKIDDKMTNIGTTDDGKETKITINSDGKRVVFEENVDFSSNGATLEGNGGVFVFKKGIKL